MLYAADFVSVNHDHQDSRHKAEQTDRLNTDYTKLMYLYSIKFTSALQHIITQLHIYCNLGSYLTIAKNP